MKRIIRNLLRSLNRNKGFLLINITGLAIGLAVSLMLMLFVATELSYDRHFINGQRIVQLNTEYFEEGIRHVEPICLRSAYTDLPSRIPGIESAVQIYRGFNVELQKEQQRFQDVTLLYADPAFFDVFGMEFISGNPTLALREPYSAVITGKMAEKLYGNTEAIGQAFSVNKELYTVKAVVKELPANTHFSFDVLVSMKSLTYLNDLGGLEFFTYYLLRSNESMPEACNMINKAYTNMLQEGFREFDLDFGSVTVKMKDIYLHSPAEFSLGARDSVQSVLTLTGLALLILLLAITNFVNLFIVQGDKRALEVGIRKTIGGSLKNIALQFFTEASAIVLSAFIIGAFLTAACIKPFASMIHKTVEPSLIISPLFIAGMMCLLVITILFSASYPAFYLSRFRPAEVIKKARKSSKRRFTGSIAIFQSVITIVLIALILVVNKQLKYLNSLPKGYDTGNVLVINNVNDKIASHYETLRQDLEKLPEIQMVSAAQHTIGGGTSGQGIHLLGSSDPSVKSINEYRIMPGLTELMKFELMEGGSFGDHDSINKSSVVLNEAAVKMLGINGSAIGKKVVMFEDPMEIVGVVRDFYYDTPARKVSPIALTCYRSTPSNLYIRFIPSLQKLEAAEKVLPVFRQYDAEFLLNARWCDDIYSGKFEKEKSLSEIVSASTMLSLVIALLGLFAIHSYSASRRTKEIGIRKVLGGKALSIIYLLSAEIIKLIVFAGMIAIPLAYFISRTWLEDYENRAQLNLALFVIPVMLQFAFVVLITALVSARIASRNPVEALRYE